MILKITTNQHIVTRLRLDGLKKPSKPKVAAAHPPFKVMIASAITALKERGGLSRQAIAKYIKANNKLSSTDAAFNAQLKKALKKGVDGGQLKQVKGTGAAGSFRLGEKKVEKKKPAKKATKAKKPKSPAKKKAVKKPAGAKKVAKPKSPAKKPAAKKAATPKKAAAKKPAAKKPAAKKPAAKKPAAKKPAAKKAAAKK